MRKLILFDIDGTILDTGGIGGDSIYKAIEAVCRQAAVFRDNPGSELRQVQMSGKTDTQIIHEILEGIVDESDIQQLLPRIFDRLTEILATACAQATQIRLLDGVRELLGLVAEHQDCLPGLLTGNNKRCANVKLSVFELNRFFQLGAFGDEARYRDALPDIAVQRAFGMTGRLFRRKEIVIIGDTPNDILCGRPFGVRAIAVATGRFPREELQKHQPDYLFDSLSDTEGVMDAILS